MKTKKLLSLLLVAVALLGILNVAVYAQENVSYVTVTQSDGSKKKFAVTASLNNAYSKASEFASEKASKNNIVTIKLPKGKIDSIICKNYITLDLTSSVTVKYGFDSCSNSKTGGYDGLRNFTVKGGTFKLSDGGNYPPIRLAHLKNVTFSGCTFNYGGSNHFIEIAASNKVTFDGCNFNGTTDAAKKSGYEAIQIDIHDKNYHFTNAGAYNNTSNDTIIIKNCTFKNVSRGVGTRNLFAGYYQKNIQIINNKFIGLGATAIVLTGMINSKVSGNVITDCAEGICYYAMTGDGNLKNVAVYDKKGKINKNCNTVISNNTITLKKSSVVTAANGIYVCGNTVTTSKTKAFNSGDYYVGNITIKNNTITTPEYAIRLFDTKNSTVTGNTIKASQKAYNAIYLGVKSDNNTVTSNKISGDFESGIVLNESSKNVIKSNTITAPVYYGVNMLANSKSNYVTKNTIKNSGAAGIVMASSTCEVLSSNIIQNSGTHGISLSSGSSSTNVNANDVSGSKANGIYIEKNAKIQNFKDNIISSSKNNGVLCLGTLNNASNNTVKNNTKLGIVYSNGSSGSVFKNTYSGNGSYDLIVQQGGTYTKLSNLASPSVKSSKSGNKVNLSWNTVSGAGSYIVFKSDKKNGTYTAYATISKTSYSIKSSDKGYYKVRAVQKVGSVCSYSGFSNVIGV